MLTVTNILLIIFDPQLSIIAIFTVSASIPYANHAKRSHYIANKHQLNFYFPMCSALTPQYISLTHKIITG